ncbi:MAG: chromosomal replication initiator protein DnaA [bacterium]
MTHDEIWQAALGELELNLSKANFTTWFRNTSILSNNDGVVTIGVPNGFTKEWLKNKYHKSVFKVLQNVTNHGVREIHYEVSTIRRMEEVKNVEAGTVEVEVAPAMNSTTIPINGINKKYNFNNFVVGSSNELARAACHAVSQNPGTTYNPLFIYGGVGLGKTHLLQSIGNEVSRNNPNYKVVYVTCEKFTEDFIYFIQNESGKNGESKFKAKYRSADVLLIDDIQFLGSKERTQEEFFHTFNTLYQNNKQIVLTSDRPPKAIARLEDRLVSRFQGGMLADIGMPDVETRKAILQNKCRDREIEVDDEVCTYIAENIQNNIRELEGALARVLAHAQLNNIQPDLEVTKQVLKSVLADPGRKALSSKQVISTVAEFFNIKTDDLLAKNRKKEVAWPRQITMYIMRDEMKASYPMIGQEIGGRDHTTAMHAHDQVTRRLEIDDNLRQELELIKQKLYLNNR